jgi:hypothetical protein
MRNPFAPSLMIRIAGHAISLSRIDRHSRASLPAVLAESQVDGNDLNSPEALALRLRTLLSDASAKRARTQVLLADSLVRYFTVTPPANAVKLADCRAAAGMRFQSLYGEAPSAWHIEADWQVGAPFIACAVPASLLAAVQRVLREQRLPLIGLTPQFIWMWNRSRRTLQGDEWFGVIHEDGVTVGVMHGGKLQAIRSLSTPNDDDGQLVWLTSRLAREALLLNQSAPKRLILAGNLPPGCVPGARENLIVTHIDNTPDAASQRSRARGFIARLARRV